MESEEPSILEASAAEVRRWVLTSLREERRSRPVDSTRAVRAAALEAYSCDGDGDCNIGGDGDGSERFFFLERFVEGFASS